MNEMHENFSIDIVVPVYNEEALFENLYAAAARAVHADWRLLIVYDRPDDTTLRTAQPIADRDPRVQLIFNEKGGVADAIKIGLRRAQAEAVMVTAVDVPEDIVCAKQAAALLRSGRHALVAFSRYMPGGSRFAGSFLNRTLSRLASLSLHYLAGIPIHDATSGSKMYRKSFLDSITIESTEGWSIALEITVKAHAAGESMTEIPVTQMKRQAGTSKFKLLKWLPHYLRWYFFAFRIRFQKRALAFVAIAGMITIGTIYMLPNVLIRQDLARRRLPYVPVTIVSDIDEAQLYAPQVAAVARGNYRYGDLALREHRADPTLLRPLGPMVFGSIGRIVGLERFFFIMDAVFPPLIFLFVLLFCYQLTRNLFISTSAATIFSFFKEVASYPPFSLGFEFKSFIANFIPFVFSGNYSTQFSLARFLTPEWTFVPLTLFLLLWARSLSSRRWWWTALAGMLYGLLFYSYPFDWIAVSVMIGTFLILNVIDGEWPSVRRTVLLLIIGLLISVPFWISLWQIHDLSQYQELLNRTGLEVGRAFRWSHLPHFAVWLAAAAWLWRGRKQETWSRWAAAIFISAFIVLNIQLITGFVPSPMLFISYSFAPALLGAGLVLLQTVSRRLPRIRRLMPAARILVGIALALVLIRNIQIPVGYARQHALDFTVPPAILDSFRWMNANLPPDQVVMTPAVSTATHLLIYTTAKIYFPAVSIVSTASNQELVERLMVSEYIFGADNIRLQRDFDPGGIYAILYNDVYPQTPDRFYARGSYRNFRDMHELLDRARDRWNTDRAGLLKNYDFEYLFVGPDERRLFPQFNPAQAPVCLTPVYHHAEVDIYRVC